MRTILLILGGYLLGSIPSAYLAGRWLKGIDLRQYGSGTVSGSMVWEHVAHWAVIPVGIFDLLKAVVPTWLAIQLGLGQHAAAAVGLAATVGHNWPLYLGFTGGRGISPFLGALLVLFPWGFLWILAFLAVGWLIGDSAPLAIGALITLPVFANWLGTSAPITSTSIGMLLVTLAKRVQANGRPLPPPGPERRQVILRRLLLDRDIVPHKEWIRRRPEN
ncbi:MAG TPA: glycerol-3-phosphate acyltransferase [Chloroflexi bacterium]|nr:glycerol-3-phosphate acyltransferase [Chloroflexota bacterium]